MWRSKPQLSWDPWVKTYSISCHKRLTLFGKIRISGPCLLFVSLIMRGHNYFMKRGSKTRMSRILALTDTGFVLISICYTSPQYLYDITKVEK